MAGVAKHSSSRLLTARTCQSLAAFNTETAPPSPIRNTLSSAATGDAKYLSIAPCSRPCLITDPVLGSNDISSPPSLTMYNTPLYSSVEGTCGTGFWYFHRMLPDVTSPFPPG